MGGQSAFEIYLRTGRRYIAPAELVETKFNPWHDPDDGQFTFANGGRTSGSGAGQAEGADRFSPKNPRNHSTYVVRKGDSLSRIAGTRKGLRVSDLAELNGISVDATLRPGQRLIVPTEAYLEAGRQRGTIS